MPNTIAETIAENLQRLVNAKNAIANAITEKGGTVASSDGLEDFASDITTIPKGDVPKNDVNFYDYDGTIVQSYSAADFANLSELPTNPIHEGLTAQGWNWELAAAKTHVAANGKLDIGQMYVTSDGKTRIYVHMEDGRLNPELNLTFAQAGSFTVDWGDETTPDTISGNANALGTIAHTYSNPGDYVIAVTVNSGKISITPANNSSQLFKKANKTNNENWVYANCIRAIKLGNGVTSLGYGAFNRCQSLKSITIPSGVTSIEGQAFYSCQSLKSIVIPSGVTNIENYTFGSCYSLASITIPSGVTSIGDFAFHECESLISIVIPSGVTSIGDLAFGYCQSLKSITIPSGVTSMGNRTFLYCYSLASITIPSGVTSIGDSVFERCYSLKSVTISSGVTSIGNSVFLNCYSLKSVTIPSGVTNIKNYTFGSCYSLASITIPSGVTSIGNNSFNECYGLGYIKFTSDTPPTVSYYTFRNISTDCIIYVPAGKLQTYKTASNYPNSSTYTYQEYTI